MKVVLPVVVVACLVGCGTPGRRPVGLPPPEYEEPRVEPWSPPAAPSAAPVAPAGPPAAPSDAAATAPSDAAVAPGPPLESAGGSGATLRPGTP